MTLYGNSDHSGGIWTERKYAIDGPDDATRVRLVEQGQNTGFAATAFQGDTPREGAHVA
jgi:hypothetical protein